MTVRENELTQQLAACQAELAVVRAENQLLRQENQLLRQKVDLLVHRCFGASSEKLDPAQLDLLQLPGTPVATEPVAPPPPSARPSAPRPRTVRAPRLPDHLPVVEEVVDPEVVKAQPEHWRLIGEEVSERLDFEPGRFLKRRLVRRTYVPRVTTDEAVPVTAPLPPCLQERGLVAPGLLAHVLVSKYCDHLPLYRLEQIFERRYGVNVPRQTMAGWVALAAEWLQPIYEEIQAGVLEEGYVQLDETPIEYLEPGHGQTRVGFLWVGSRPQGDVFFAWRTSRAAACLDTIIPVDFKGTIQADGYAGYRAFVRGRDGGIVLAGCWAHVRRKFHEARGQLPRVSAWVLRHIQNIYRVEARLRELGAGPALRAAIRAFESRPIIERLRLALTRLKGSGRILPQSLLGAAIDYALGLWPTLEVYLGDGRVEIDNNLVENVTPSLGLRFLCRGADNAEYPRPERICLRVSRLFLGIIKSLRERPIIAKTPARADVEAAWVLSGA